MRSFPLPAKRKGRISGCLQGQPLVYQTHIKHSTYPKSERAVIQAVDVYPCKRERSEHGQGESAPFQE